MKRVTLLLCLVLATSLPAAAQHQELLVCGWFSNSVQSYDGVTGAFVDVFVTTGSGGINAPSDILLRDREPELRMFGPLPGTAGMVNDFTVTKALRGETVFMAWGTINAPTAIPPCPGLFAFLGNPSLFATVPSDAIGTATFSTFIPASASGLQVLLQAVTISTCRRSNVIAYRFP